MAIDYGDFDIISAISHQHSGYTFKQDDMYVLVTLPNGTKVAAIPIPAAWYHTVRNNKIAVEGLKVLAVEWLKENWENK